MKKLFTSLFAVLFAAMLLAQPAQTRIRVSVAADHSDWTYTTGQKAVFNIRVTKDENLIPDAQIKYALSYDTVDPYLTKEVVAKDGTFAVKTDGMKTPGFLRCKVTATVDGREYVGVATAGFSPEKIEPTVQDPADFEAFWAKQKASVADIPLEPILRLLPEKCDSEFDVYEASVRNTGSSRIYGILTIPKAEGKYPVALNVPGAGVHQMSGSKTPGVITLQIGIHGIPVTMDASVYTAIRSGALRNYEYSDTDDPARNYYRRVYLGCVRCIDFLTSLDKFDGKNVIVRGSSQGGALSIVTAGLDSRVTAISAYFPALSDMAGYLHGRCGGWPHMFKRLDPKDPVTKVKENAVAYYDVVNFARRVKCPGFYYQGYNDETCPPTSSFAVFNVITAPKTLEVVPETAHWHYSETGQHSADWIKSQYK